MGNTTQGVDADMAPTHVDPNVSHGDKYAKYAYDKSNKHQHFMAIFQISYSTILFNFCPKHQWCNHSPTGRFYQKHRVMRFEYRLTNCSPDLHARL